MVASSFHPNGGRFMYRRGSTTTRGPSLKSKISKIGKRPHQSALRLARRGGEGRAGEFHAAKTKWREDSLVTEKGPHGQFTAEDGFITAKPESVTNAEKSFALQPSDRAEGDGWQICDPTAQSNWSTVGSDTGSCFAFLYNENRANEQEAAPEDHAQQHQEQPLVRCASEVTLLTSMAEGIRIVC